MPNTLVPAAATGLPTATRLTRSEEYLHLFEQRRCIDRRLSELEEMIGPHMERLLDELTRGEILSLTLPKSGLRIVATCDGSLVCRGGRA